MAVMEGSLSKWTNVMKGWQYRWFVLDENSGLLSYYTSKEKMMRGVRRGCVRLKGAVLGIDDEDDSTFTITVDHKTFHFQARDAEERENWVRALEDTIARHSSRMRWESNRPPATIKDFDNKVSEADAYLQLLIEQTKKWEEGIRLVQDIEEKSQCQLILEHANAMLHNIKHSIVLLQIAKNTAHPVNGVYQPRPDSSGMHTLLAEEYLDLIVLPCHSPVQQGVELGSECLERRHSRTLTIGATPPTLVVPEMSYSSSEGEDDFFDANDSPFTSGSQAATPTGVHSASLHPDELNNTQTDLVADLPLVASRSPNIARSNRKDDGIDYDSLYNDDEEDELPMESHGSVIKHLLSQVKIGMDLTKVVLPTFILERRSLLEMYADYFAHPDLFVRIAELKTPRERIVQVVKWYLSSYHAGRKSTVAKKPYNPILGEVFCCHWNIPEATEDTSNLVNDGPVPWASGEQLTFVAEQVSHHPPISAFYAEHYNKRITFNAHIYTKSKFLGLSVCVYNIGEGVVSVLDYDEEYILSFPNGYGRSILTIPWIELGGSVSIRCPKSGYYCEIEFLTKPFYGNKKHRVQAEIYSPEDKKSFMSISGEWNGVLEAKLADEEKPTVFINVNAMSVTSKLVRPIKEQSDNESRKVWMHVTRALKFNEIEKATSAKFKVEQRQREEAKDRKDSRTEWQNKLFRREPEENWMYINSLHTRLANQ